MVAVVAQLFRMGTPAWEVAVRTGVVYLVVLAGFRLLGKREIGQMNVVDLVLLLLIANAVQNAMVGPDLSIEGGLVAAGVLLGANRLISAVRLRSPLAGRQRFAAVRPRNGGVCYDSRSFLARRS